MRKKIINLLRQDSKWNIVEEYCFKSRNYEVDENGNFYRNGQLVVVKSDRVKTFTHCLTDDDNVHRRFKLHQIVYQVFGKEKIKDGYSVDHIKRLDRLNNSIYNLRLANRKKQYENRDASTPQFKKVKCLNNGVVYKSCQDAEIKLNLTKNTVSRVARGERKSIHGYFFEYIA
jgi:hypothetical protein